MIWTIGISPLNVFDNKYDACPIPQKSGQCCKHFVSRSLSLENNHAKADMFDDKNADGSATGCEIAAVITDYAP